jgi:hypothetical protein
MARPVELGTRRPQAVHERAGPRAIAVLRHRPPVPFPVQSPRADGRGNTLSMPGLDSAWMFEIEQLHLAGPDLAADGRGADLLAWTDSFPPALRAREPWIIHFHAVGLRLTSDAFPAAQWMQEQARDEFQARGERPGYVRALAELGTLSALQGRPNDARRHLRDALIELRGEDRGLQDSVRAQLADLELAVFDAGTTRPRFDDEGALLGVDDVIRSRLEVALAEERLTTHGLKLLREQYGLTPAETNVFVEYYLTNDPADCIEPKRRALARRLHLSENTLMHHITSVRRKLGLVARSGSATVLMWCLSAGITKLDAVAAEGAPGRSPQSGG